MKPGRVFITLASMLLLIITAILIPLGCMETTISTTETAGKDETANLQREMQGKVQAVKDREAELASMIHGMINEKRKSNGLKSLQWDQSLANIAYLHSKDMAERDYFDHISPEGEDFADRYAEHGYHLETQIGNHVYVGGENLFLNNVVRSYQYDPETGEIYEYTYNTLDDLAVSTVEGWMDSPGHRENILTPFTREGIGIFVTDEGEVYITENFS
jgi:uncharacterized protein YkwD